MSVESVVESVIFGVILSAKWWFQKEILLFCQQNSGLSEDCGFLELGKQFGHGEYPTPKKCRFGMEWFVLPFLLQALHGLKQGFHSFDLLLHSWVKAT